jgi:phage tail-like protein
MATGVRKDPFRAFNFLVVIDNLTIGAFSEVTGLTAEGDAVAYREGSDKINSVRQLIGLRKYSAITLKHGFLANLELVNWSASVAASNPDGSARRNGTIVLQDEAHNPVLQFHFSNGWINKLEGPHLNASGNEVAIESVEIVHEGLEITLP